MKKLFYILLGMTCIASAHVHTYKPSNDDRLFDTISSQNLAIVMFYHDEKNDKNTHAAKKNFQAASRNEPYVAFIYANIDKDDILSTAQEFGAQKFPTYMLFKNGKGVVQKPGFMSKYAIIDFIERHFKSDINKILKLRREQAQRRAEQARINAAYWGPYWGFGWGWGGYPYGGGYWGAPYYGYYW
jgi:thioredoxin-related protein